MIYFSPQQKNTKSFSGFTLVEMLVVLGLFSFIMTLATSVLYSTQAINIKLQETQAVLDNVNVSLETMSRDIRYGSDFHCSTMLSDPSFLLRKSCQYEGGIGGRYLFFKPIDAASTSDRVAYYASTTLTGNVILKDEYYVGKGTTTYEITADDVKIKSLIFFVSGADSTTASKNVDSPLVDYVQPLVTFGISGETIPVKVGASSTSFIMQSSISSRILDN